MDGLSADRRGKGTCSVTITAQSAPFTCLHLAPSTRLSTVKAYPRIKEKQKGVQQDQLSCSASLGTCLDSSVNTFFRGSPGLNGSKGTA